MDSIVVELHAHGAHVTAGFSGLPSDPTDVTRLTPATVEVWDDGLANTRRYEKRESASSQPQTLGWIKGVYSDAIEYTGMTREMRGLGFMYGIVIGLPISIGIGGCGIFLMSVTMRFENLWVATSFIMAVMMAVLGIGGGARILGALMRNDLFKPEDLPIIFDRKRRKVYRLVQDHQAGFWGIFKPWPLMACEYEWDLIDVEHRIVTSVNGATVRRDHALVFLVRKSRADASVIDAFQIANAHALGESLVDPMWEHIRRFMEEDGPHLPDRMEALANLEAPTSWWESMGTVSAFGPKFSTHWNNAPVITTFMLLLFPITLPIMLLWGTGNYLSFRTAIPVQWPKVVLERIGQPLSSMSRNETGLKI